MVVFTSIIPLPVLFADSAQSLLDASEKLIFQSETLRKDLGESNAEDNKDGEVIIDTGPEPSINEILDTGPAFELKKIKLQGHYVFSGMELSQYTDKYINRKIHLSDLRLLAREITDHYRINGYITSRAYVPFQKIENQTAVLNVLEGLPGTLSVEGSRYFSTSYYDNAFKLKSDKPLNSTELEKSLREINRNAHIHSKLYLLAGEQPGTTDIILKTEETDPVSIYYQLHNKGSSSTHHSRHAFHFNHDSFFGNGDALRAAYILTEEGSISGGYTYYSFSAPDPDLSFRISGSYFRSLLTNHLKSSEIKGVSTSVTAGTSYTLHRNAASLFQVDAGFEVKDSKTSLNDLKINMDRMRVATVGIRFLTEIYGIRVYGAQDTHIGIPDIFGGSQTDDINTTRINTGGRFAYYTGTLTAVQKIQRYQSIKFAASGQLSNVNLTSLERFRAGGSNSVRAYPESDSSGDSGYLISGELSCPLPGLNPDAKSILSKKTLGSTYRWMLFFDMAKTYNLERVSAESEKNRLLMGAGIGLNINLGDIFNAEMTYAFPFGDPSTDEDRNQFFFSMQSGF